MKKSTFFFSITGLGLYMFMPVHAGTSIPMQPEESSLAACPAIDNAETDSLRHKQTNGISVDLEEAVVVASPKETTFFHRQPISASVYNAQSLAVTGAENIKGLAAFTPNVFMPDYGSRLTSAAYIRGVGSRINTPAVGLYVDNVPYIDKSAYDFAFLDVTRVDILRGPQATLYGRNAMGGLVRVFTADPFSRYGTDISFSATGRTGGRSMKAVTYLHPSSQTALSVGGFYEGENGFYRNAFTGEKADGSESGGGKIRFGWQPAEALRIDLTGSYEYSDESACPYFLVKSNDMTVAEDGVGRITQNRQSSYRRELLNTGLGIEWRNTSFTLSSITSFQHLRDRLFMDQDFVSSDIFTLEQRQRMNIFTEELSLKSRSGSRWQWTTGAFFMYQNMETTCPVTFYDGGVQFLNRQFAAVMPQNPPMSLAFTTDNLRFDAALSTPALNAALFHQSTFDLTSGLSLIAGLRLDYDHTELDRTSGAGNAMTYRFSMPAFRINADLKADPALAGRLKDDTWQLLPKLALQYNHASGRGNVYVAVSKGYRSGGYNIQSYSDLSQSQLRRDMMLGVKNYSIETINAMPLPDASKQAAIAGLTRVLDPNIPEMSRVSALSYKPEQSWNVELGGHLKFFSGVLGMDYTFFYMRTKDQQLARFAESGMGRVMVNAGRTRSLGAEVALRTSLLSDRLSLTAAYGYTNAEFTDYDLGQNNGISVNYEGNRVPFSPDHTLGFTAAFRQPMDGRVVKTLGCSANLAGAGRIYWDEANSFSQPFYATLGVNLSAELTGDVGLNLWARNLTGTRYSAFSFDSMGNRFAQYGNPRCFGVDVSLHF